MYSTLKKQLVIHLQIQCNIYSNKLSPTLIK